MHFFPSRTVALDILGLQVHWYGIMYAIGALLGLYLLPRIQTERDLRLSSDEWLTVVTVVMIGIVVGGRLGYVLFYEPLHFLQHPLDVFAVWKGGMASHGGFIGVTLALFYLSRRLEVDVRTLADLVIIPVAIGLALGRIGNFINQELYGTPTSLPWGIAIPGVPGLRHPTQMYAVLKDLTIAVICFLYLRHARPIVPGRTVALFLMLYGVLRFLIEFIRVDGYPPIVVLGLTFTRGQLLTIPIFFAGVFLWIVLGSTRLRRMILREGG